mmetsp:Transcript_19573/g.58344  ORF Transcript_19573/g.58344 Transcript_19573/m.58344 type:complete len:641 (+) Transcript_19573:232-2154(+)
MTEWKLRGAMFRGRETSFKGSRFEGDRLSFKCTNFCDADYHTVNFTGIAFECQTMDFAGMEFDCKTINFSDSTFSGDYTVFRRATFAAGNIWFSRTKFISTCETYFYRARFIGNDISFYHTEFTGKWTDFRSTKFDGNARVNFNGASLTAERTSFNNAALGTAEFRGVTLLNAADFAGADMSQTKHLAAMKRVSSGRMASVLPLDFKNSFEDPRQFETGWIQRKRVADARFKCGVLEDAVFAARVARKPLPPCIQKNLELAVKDFREALEEEKKMDADMWPAEELPADPDVLDKIDPSDTATLNAMVTAYRKELMAWAVWSNSEGNTPDLADDVIHLGPREVSEDDTVTSPSADWVAERPERVATLEASIETLQRRRSSHGERRRCCGRVRARRVTPTQTADAVKQKTTRDLKAAVRDGTAHVDLNRVTVDRGTAVLFWLVALGRGGTVLHRENLLAQKRQIELAVALLEAVRGCTITKDTLTDHLMDWGDLRALENLLLQLDQQRGGVRANGMVLKVIELVLHPHSVAPPDSADLNEVVWGTPMKGLAAMEVFEPAFRTNDPPRGILSAVRTIGRRLRDPGFPSMMQRLAQEEGYLDVLLGVHDKVETAFSQVVLSALFGISTFLANLAFAASNLDENV